MTTSMFGAPLGFRTYDEDQAKLAEMASMRDLRAGQTRHQDALVGLNRAQADVMRRKQASEEGKLAIMQKAAAGMSAAGAPAGAAGDPLAEAEAQLQGLGRMAGILAAGGELEDATKITQQVASGLSSLSSARNQAATRKKSELAAQLSKLRLVQETLAGVTSPQSHANAVLALQANPLLAGEQLPQSLMTYNPGALRAFLSGSPAEIKKRELQLKEIDSGRKQGDSESLRALREIQGRVAEERVSIARTRAEAVGKAGGGAKDIGNMTAGALQAVRAELKRQGIEVEDEDRGAIAQSLAERAAAISKNNTAINPEQARARVIREAIEAGEITRPKVGSMEVPFSKSSFTPKQGSISKPNPMELSIDKLKPNQYYQDDDGSVIKFLGRGKDGKPRYEKTIPKGRTPQAVGGALAEEDEE